MLLDVISSCGDVSSLATATADVTLLTAGDSSTSAERTLLH